MQVFVVIVAKTGKIVAVYSTEAKAAAWIATTSLPLMYAVRTYTVQ